MIFDMDETEMMQRNDITSLNDIKQLVDAFYGKVRADEILAGIFHDRIQDRWPEHLEKMYRFWQTLLLDEHTYFGAPFPPHAKMPVKQQHFERWLALFEETVNELFVGEKAEEAKWRGRKMAQMFEWKIEQFQKMA